MATPGPHSYRNPSGEIRTYLANNEIIGLFGAFRVLRLIVLPWLGNPERTISDLATLFTSALGFGFPTTVFVIFGILFVLAVGASVPAFVVYGWATRKIDFRYLRFFAGFGTTVIVLVGSSGLYWWGTEVWPEYRDEGVYDYQIENLVRRLRSRFEPDPANPQLLVTVRGRGYKLIVRE